MKAYDPDDSLEWQLVLNEISTFIDVDNQLSIDHAPITLSYRLTNALIPPLPEGVDRVLSNIQLYSLDEILIIGNYQDQIKFSECKYPSFSFDVEEILLLVTLDMYRILQAVERQPTESAISLEDRTTTQSPANQQKDILVSIANRMKSLLFLYQLRIYTRKNLRSVPTLTNIFFINQHSAKSTLSPHLPSKNYHSTVLFFFISPPMVMKHTAKTKLSNLMVSVE